MSSRCKLILVRHGYSRATELKMVGGHVGCRGLSTEGLLQAERLSRRWLKSPPFDDELPFGAAYSSVMRRSIETAAAVLSPLGLSLKETKCDLCEIHPGQADGLMWSDVSEKFGDVDIFSNPFVPIAPEGECWNDVRNRASRILISISGKHLGSTVLVFTHKGVIDSTLDSWLGVSPKSLRLGSSNTGITTWSIERDKQGVFRPLLVSYNDSAHLDG